MMRRGQQLRCPKKLLKNIFFGAPWLADFLVQKHDVFGVTLQNWMVIAAVVVIAALVWSASRQIGQAN
jgi:hypothetical protein